MLTDNNKPLYWAVRNGKEAISLEMNLIVDLPQEAREKLIVALRALAEAEPIVRNME